MSAKRSFFLKQWVALLFICALGNIAQAQSEYSKLVVFGDSLSDTGNLAIIDLPSPYFNNRISNGPVLADILADAIGSNAGRSGHLLGREQGFNYAVSGGNILGDDREDLSSQVSAYLNRSGNVADSDALYLVFMGGNDLRALRSVESQVAADQKVSAIIARLKAQLTRLTNAGARFFIVPNVANIGRLPETLDREGSSPGIAARADWYSRRYNNALKVMLTNFRPTPDLQLLEFDLFSAFENILNNPSRFGFNTIEQGCFNPSELTVELDCLIFGFNQRVFFDQLHPSSATNMLISDRLLENRLPFGRSVDMKPLTSAITLLLLDD